MAHIISTSEEKFEFWLNFLSLSEWSSEIIQSWKKLTTLIKLLGMFSIYICNIHPNKTLTQWYAELWYLDKDGQWHTDIEISGKSQIDCYINGIKESKQIIAQTKFIYE